MRRWKQYISAATAAALVLTAIPVGTTTTVQAEESAVTVDNTVRLQPHQASRFNDTNGDGLGEFEGWGTSLCWWANRLGYSEKLTADAAKVFFSDDGLDMNIGRYNVGGGDNVGTEDDGSDFWHAEHIVRSDSVVPGYCVDVTPVEEGKTEADYANFDRVDLECGYAWNYDWDADKNQMNILLAAAKASGEDFIGEAFSNSPPYFMTVSGCSSGNTDANVDNLRKDSYNAFAAYMADVIVHWAKEGVFNFQSVTPMNEPYTNYWGANSNKQEGCHFDIGDSQSNIIVALHKELTAQTAEMEDGAAKTALENIIYSASDETSIDTAITSYNALSDEAKEIVTRIDTHTYSGSNRAGLRALAEESSENLWMSEVDGAFDIGTNSGEMGAALGLAERIMTDLNGLKSSAWILWNAVDNHVDADLDGSTDGKYDPDTLEALYTKNKFDMESGYWGIAIGDHDNQEIILTQKYYAYGQFSRYIRPGDTIIASSGNTLATYDAKNNEVVIVAINTAEEDQTWKFNLGSFATVGTEVKAIRTSGSMADGEHWADVSDSVNTVVDTVNKNFTTTLKGNSITTYIMDGVTYDASTDELLNMTEVKLYESMVTGSTPWNGDETNGVKNVYDGSFTTFFDGVEDGWVQIDLGQAEDITAISYAPRPKYADRSVGASIYGSNDGASWDLLYTITSTPTVGEETFVYADYFKSGKTEYRYIKYAVPSSTTEKAYYCNLAEIKIYSNADLIKTISKYVALTGGHTYTEETKAVFDKAIEEAKAIDAATATEDEIKAATQAIIDAYNALKEIFNYTSFSGVNGDILYDNKGDMIQAHGGQVQKFTYDIDQDGVLEEEDTFWFWVGEDKTNDYRPCPGIKGYISYDLYNWIDMGNVLKTAESWEQFTTDEYFTSLYGSAGVQEGDENYEELYAIYGDIWAPNDSNSGCVIERPKMLYNDKTGKYVIWFHADGQTPGGTGSNYAKAKAGVAISDSPFGPFKLLGSYLLNYDENASHGFDSTNATENDPTGGGGHVRDMNLFKDTDGTAYVLYSSDGNETMHIAQLNDDYTMVKEPTINNDAQNPYFSRNFVGESREAPAMFKYKDKYFMISSGCTGWYPNQAKYAVADHPLGPWTMVGDPCIGEGSGTTFSTQSTCVIPVDPENGKYIYMGDRWSNPDEGNQLRYSRYVWLPIEFTSDTEIVLRPHADWSLEILDNMKPCTLVTDIPSVVTSMEELVAVLPSEVEILEEGATETIKMGVTWNGIPDADPAIGTLNISGEMENGRVITRTIEVMDKNMIYFFDSAAEYEDTEASFFTAAKETLGTTLRNSAADQPYTAASHAGYTGTYGTDIGEKSVGDDIWSHGWWAYGSKSIDYAFDLEAGTYTVATGYQEWWSTSRATVITAKTADETLATSSFTLGSADTALQQNITFTLEEAATVTVSISKPGSAADPVMSWIAVIQDESAGELADTSTLLATIEDAKKIDTANFTKASKKALAEALAAAELTAGDVRKTQAEINAANEALRAVVAGLQTVKEYLEAGIKANTVDAATKANYTSASWAVYEKVLAHANALLAKGSFEEYEVKDAVDALAEAKGLLEAAKENAGSVEEEKVTVAKTTINTAKAAGGKKLKLTWKKVTGASGYEIQCALKKNFKTGLKKAVIKKNTTKTTIKKLKKGKKYYVRIRAYKTVKVNGKSQKVYGDWSKVKTSSKIK
ncbi:MAG: family 43 glycosylhydrolase [Lachnospiraceae bacterium]|nr:family 43 glycosylhydrolase [Lachnospiraceae bacterium]